RSARSSRLRTKHGAIARPIPRPAPVTTAPSPASFMSGLPFYARSRHPAVGVLTDVVRFVNVWSGPPGRSRVVEAVLVGCGAMSRAWLDAARQIDGLKIVGLVDLDLDRARSRAAEFRLDGADTAASLDAMLDKRRPDAVFDAVVPTARTLVARSAFASGCHLLSEKPLAASLDEARAVVAAARKAGRVHAVTQNRRYHPSVRRIRRFLNMGAVGKPTGIHCDFFLAPHFGGFREEMAHVLLLDMAIHAFDAARAMTGLEAERVYCREW